MECPTLIPTYFSTYTVEKLLSAMKSVCSITSIDDNVYRHRLKESGSSVKVKVTRGPLKTRFSLSGVRIEVVEGR